MSMLNIDGSQGEGGGQILRTSLAMSILTSTPLRIDNIRAGRKKPGLQRQHLTAVLAAARISGAEVLGAQLGSSRLTFTPAGVFPGRHAFDVGTAGSATLVLQTILPPLLLADGPSDITLEGGTHNPFAPPFDFLEQAFLPLVNRMGPTVEAQLERPGFFPAGGGCVQVSISPASQLAPLVLHERGEIQRIVVRAMVARLPVHIAEREIDVIRQKLRRYTMETHVEEIEDARGPGNAVTIRVESEHVTELFTGFGQRGVRAEDVARTAAREAQAYLAAEVPVGEHLADQLLVPLALAGGGSFVTLLPTAHTRTNIDVLRLFLDVDIRIDELDAKRWRVTVG